MKRLLSVVLTLAMLLTLLPQGFVLAEASGVPSGYIAVYTADDLYGIRDDMSAKYILMADIDLTDYQPAEDPTEPTTPTYVTVPDELPPIIIDDDDWEDDDETQYPTNPSAPDDELPTCPVGDDDDDETQYTYETSEPDELPTIPIFDDEDEWELDGFSAIQLSERGVTYVTDPDELPTVPFIDDDDEWEDELPTVPVGTEPTETDPDELPTVPIVEDEDEDETDPTETDPDPDELPTVPIVEDEDETDPTDPDPDELPTVPIVEDEDEDETDPAEDEYEANLIGGTFTGILEGDGHTITGATGLFFRNEGTIANLTLKDTNWEAVDPYVGGVACLNYGTIRNVDLVNVNITAVHNLIKGSVMNCGGICGTNYGHIEYCNVLSGSISASQNRRESGDKVYRLQIGGIAGFCGKDSVINACMNAASVTGENADDTPVRIGGIAGCEKQALILNAWNRGTVTAKQHLNDPVYAEAGGIVGCASEDARLCDIANHGDVNIQGIIGLAHMGGVIGSCEDAVLTNCYNAGALTSERSSSNLYCGGVFGYGITITMKDCYYLNTAPKGAGNGRDMGVALTAAQMEQQASFEGYDFENIWVMGTCSTKYPLPILLASHQHSYVYASVEPTCTEDGFYGMRCTLCGEFDPDNSTRVSKNGHSFGPWITMVTGSCTVDGVKSRTCSDCDFKETSTILAPGHNVVVDAAKAPTCTKSGLTEGQHCVTCNTVLVKQETIPALGHDVVIDAAKAPTCTESGLTEGKHCARCNTVLTAQKTVNALGHDVVIDAAKAPTCTESGLTEGKHCARCNTVLTAQKTVNALGHDVVVDAAKAPSCTESGLTEGKHCARCDAVLVEQEIVAALGHVIVNDPAVAATCTETGLTEGKHCSHCHAVLVAQETIPALGHDVVTDAAKAATCTETGLTEGKHCARCEVVLVAQETIPALGHDVVTDAAKAATCTETGLTEGKHCARCEAVLVAQEVVSALGHDMDHGVCTRCGEIDQDYIDNAGRFVVGNATTVIGGTFEVPVSIENNPGITTAGLDLYYDSNVLELVKAEDSGLLKGDVTFGDKLTKVPYKMNWNDWSAKEDNTANGEIVRLTFRVKGDAEIGTTKIGIRFAARDVYNSDMIPARFVVTEGTVRIEDFIPGDSNHDGQLNQIDYILLRRYLAGWENVPINPESCDMNGDQEVNQMDYTIMRRMLAGWFDEGTAAAPTKRSITRNAAEAIKITASSAIVAAGEQVQVAIAISNNPGIIALQLDVSYDQNAMKLVKAVDTGILKGDVTFSGYNRVPYIMAWNDAIATENNYSNGDVAILTFEVLDTAAAGTYPISLNVKNGNLVDFDLNNVASSIEDGSITVTKAALTYVAAVEATCTEAGHSEYWLDEATGTMYADAEGKTVTNAAAVAIAATGHGYELMPATEATCTEPAKSVGMHCPKCGLVFVQPTETPALGHNYVDGVCTRCGEMDSALEEIRQKLMPWTVSLSLRSDLSMNYYVRNRVLEGVQNPYILFTKTLYDEAGNEIGSVTERVDVYSPKSDSRVFTFRGIAAREMSSKITARVCGTVNGVNLVGDPFEFSVYEYAMQQLNGKVDIALRTLLINLLNYGAAAQIQFSYNTANLVNADVTEDDQALVAGQQVEWVKNTKLRRRSSATVHFANVSLSLKDRIMTNVYLNLNDYTGNVADLEMVFSYDGKEVVVDGSEFDIDRACFDSLTAAQLRTVVTITVREKESKLQVSDTYLFSPESYAFSVVDSDGMTASFKNLMEQMMRYADSAQDFLIG